jgi:predicted acetyltransferase
MHLVHRSTSGQLPTSSFGMLNENGEVLGFCQVRHRPSCHANLPPEAGNHVYYEIAAPFRGRGYGKILMGLALAEAKRIGLERVRISCLRDHAVSRRIILGTGAVWLRDFVCAQGRRYHLFEVNSAP